MGSAKRETLAFLGKKALLFPKKQGLEGQGNCGIAIANINLFGVDHDDRCHYRSRL